jgi:APA family basic amino acid/polyamine antiporter
LLVQKVYKKWDKEMNNEQNPKLLQKLNLIDATLLVIGSVIGSGIFLTSGIIAQSLPSPEWILFVWFLGAVLSLFGGLTFAELGAMIPEAGGQYVYLREAYGPLAGFMYGWAAILVTQTGGIAALAVGFAEYFAYFVPIFSLNNYLIDLGGLTISFGQLLAVISIGILTIINYFGIRSGSSVQNFFTILKLIAIGILVIAGLYIAVSSGESTGTETIPLMPSGGPFFAAIGVSLIAVLWTFDGWYSVNTVASEIKNVRRNLPLSLFIGISLIGIIYLFVNLFYVTTLPMSEMAGVVRIGEKVTSFTFGSAAGTLMAGLILISILGCLSATIIYGPRIYYAMAEDGLFFKKFATVHPRYHTPTTAIIWQGIFASLLCLTGSYEQLFTYVVFAVLLFFVGVVTAVFVLRRTRPDAERPYRVWGYPVVPGLFGLIIIWIMINTLIEKPVESVIGLVLILVGLPVYFYWQRR